MRTAAGGWSTSSGSASTGSKFTSGCGTARRRAMFTGIVTDVGTIRSVEQRGDLRLQIACGYDMVTIDLGASIACSGVCLTVVDKGEDWFAVDVSAETVSRTAADRWMEGSKLNLERALRLGDELGGHIVTGHVDAVAQVVGTCAEGDSMQVGLSVPNE